MTLTEICSCGKDRLFFWFVQILAIFCRIGKDCYSLGPRTAIHIGTYSTLTRLLSYTPLRDRLHLIVLPCTPRRSPSRTTNAAMLE